MGISAFFAALQVAPQLLGLVDQVVLSVEQTLQGVPGSQKLNAALVKLDGWLKLAGTDVSAIAGIQPLLTSLVATSVAAFNAAGAFKKAAQA